ncbi:MAG: hypothetical protein RIS41_1303 [Actinomycetota bacterium]|jgi:hypothetical protein
MGAEGAEFGVVIIGAVVITGWAFNIWALIRAVKTSDHVFRMIGKTRSGQMTLHIVGIFLNLIGVIAGFVWFWTTRKQLDAIRLQSDQPGFPPPAPER